MKDVLNVRLNAPGPSGKSEEFVVPVTNAIPRLLTAISITESSPTPPIKVENSREYPDGSSLATNPSDGPLILVRKAPAVVASPLVAAPATKVFRLLSTAIEFAVTPRRTVAFRKA